MLSCCGFTGPLFCHEKYVFNASVSFLLGAPDDPGCLDDCRLLWVTRMPRRSFSGAHAGRSLATACSSPLHVYSPTLSMSEFWVLPTSYIFLVTSEIGCPSVQFGTVETASWRGRRYRTLKFPVWQPMTQKFRIVTRADEASPGSCSRRTSGPATFFMQDSHPSSPLLSGNSLSAAPLSTPGWGCEYHGVPPLICSSAPIGPLLCLGRDGGNTQGPQNHLSTPTPARRLLPFVSVWL